MECQAPVESTLALTVKVGIMKARRRGVVREGGKLCRMREDEDYPVDSRC